MKKAFMLLIVFITLISITLIDTRFTDAVFAADTTADQVTANNVAPQVVNVSVTNPVNLQEGCYPGFGGTDVNVTCTFVVNDSNGWADIDQAFEITRFWDAGTTAWAGPGNGFNDYYTSPGDGSDCYWSAGWDHDGDGISTAINASCNFSMYFYANSAATWTCGGVFRDTTPAQSDNPPTITNTTTVNPNVGTDVLTALVNFGAVDPGDQSADQTFQINNSGNIIQDASFNGTNLTLVTTILVGNVNYWNPGAGAAVNLTGPAAEGLELNSLKPTTITGTQNTTNWNITVPPGIMPGIHSGTIWVIAKADD